jgi:serine/threonine protein kinase
MNVGPYVCETPFETAGSGSARWCLADTDGRRFFMKQFLSPVIPSPSASEALQKKQRARCDEFKRRKEALYAAVSLTLGDCVVPVTDFFVFEGRFYAVSEYIQPPVETLDNLNGLPHARARQLLFELACCLTRLHAQGVVHADLKPEHALVQKQDGCDRLRLIDFDSGFLVSDPPTDADTVEGDPTYLAPETFLRMSGAENALTERLDTFAFGLIAHRLLTGCLPGTSGRAYPYEAVLAGDAVRLSDRLPTAYRWVIRKALRSRPEERPDDGTLQRVFAPPPIQPVRTNRAVNGLSRFLLPIDKHS